jgi:hypothetical protein
MWRRRPEAASTPESVPIDLELASRVMGGTAFEKEGMSTFANPLDEAADDVFETDPPSRETSPNPIDNSVDPTAEPAKPADDDDEVGCCAGLVKTMTLALTFQGVGDWVTQVYTISGFFLSLSLVMLMDINWPDAYLLLFEWLNILVVPIKHVPFDHLLDDVELGNFMNFLCVLLIYPVLLAYVAFRRQFFNSMDAKLKWEEYAKKGFKIQTILALLVWILPPFAVRIHHLLHDDEKYDMGRADWEVFLYGEMERGGSGSGGEVMEDLMPHEANSFFVMWLWGMGMIILPFLAYRHGTRANYSIILLRKMPSSEHFGEWACAEGSVLAYLFVMLHMSTVVAAIEIAISCGPSSDCFAHHRRIGELSFVLAAILGPLFAFGIPVLLAVGTNSFIGRLEHYDTSGYLDPELFTSEGRKKFDSKKDRRKQEAERMRQLAVVVGGDVSKGQLDAFRSPPMHQVVRPFQPHLWWMRAAMMVDKVVLAFFIVGFKNESGGDVTTFTKDVQLVGALVTSGLSLLYILLIRPMNNSDETMTELISRASIVAIIAIGGINYYLPSILWDLVLILVTLGAIGALGLMFGPRKIQSVLAAMWERLLQDQKAAQASETWVKKRTAGEVMKLDDVAFKALSKQQQGWMAIHHGPTLALPKAALKSIELGEESLPTQNAHAKTEISFADNIVDVDDPWIFSTLLGWWLTTPGAKSMKSINMVTQPAPKEITAFSTTDSADLLIEAYQKHPSLQTLLGIGDGDTKVDLSDQQMDCGIAKILGAELGSNTLTPQRYGAGVTVLLMSGNTEVLIQTSTGKEDTSGFINLCANANSLTEWDVSGCNLTSDGIMSMAGAVKWEKLVKLTIDSTGHTLFEGEAQGSYTLRATDEKLNVASKMLGPCDVKLLVKWLAKENVVAKDVVLTGNNMEIEGGEDLVKFLQMQKNQAVHPAKLRSITIGVTLPLYEKFGESKLDLTAGGVDDDGLVYTIAWWLQTDSASNVEEVDLSDNELELKGVQALVNMSERPKGLKRVTISVGPEKSKIVIFDDSVTKMNLRNDSLDQYAAFSAVACLPAMPSLVSMDVLKNDLGEGLDQLVRMLGTYRNIRSICGFQKESPEANWSNLKINPVDCAVLKAEIELKGGFLEDLSTINLSNNPEMEEGVNKILDAIGNKSITSLDLSGCKLAGAVSNQIADMLAADAGTAFSRSIVLLTMDSTGSDEPRSFTLNANDTVLDVSKAGLGADDANLLGSWLQKQSVIDRLQTVKMQQNPDIGAGNRRGVLHLVDSMQNIGVTELDVSQCGLKDSATEFAQVLFGGANKFSESISSITIDCADGEVSYTLDAASKVIDLKAKKLGVADLKLVAGWLKKAQVKETAKALNMAQNPEIIGEYGKTDMSGLKDLCETVGFLWQWDVSECNTDIEATQLIANGIDWSVCQLSELKIDSSGDLSGRTERYASEATRRAAQKPYTLESHDKNVTLSGINLGSADLELLASWMGHTAGGFKQPMHAVVKELNISNNPLLGSGGAELEGLEALCSVVSKASILDLAGTKAMNSQATMVLVQKINWAKSKIAKIQLDSTGDPKNPKPYHLHDQKYMVLSERNLGYVDAMLMTQWLKRPSVASHFTGMVLNGNPCLVGEVDLQGALSKQDTYMIQFEDLCDAMNVALDDKSVEDVDLSGCGIGSKSLVHVSKHLLEGGTNRVIKTLKLDSTGDPLAPVVYELKTDAKTYEMSEKRLGLADVELMGFWLKNPDLRRFVTTMVFGKNPQIGKFSGTDDADEKIMKWLKCLTDISLLKLDLSECSLTAFNLSALAPSEARMVDTVKEKRFKDTRFKKAIKELTLTSTGDEDDEEHRKNYTLRAGPTELKIDLVNQFIGSEDLCLLGMWLSKPEVISVVQEIDLSRCPITDARRPKMLTDEQIEEGQSNFYLSGDPWIATTVDAQLDGLEGLCSALSQYRYKGKKKVPKTLTLVDTGIGDKGCLVLAKLISDCSAIVGLDVSRNMFDIAGGKCFASVVRSAAAKHQSLHWIKLGAKEAVTIPISKKKIKTLDLSKAAADGPIGPIEAAVLAGALLTMPNIRELDLSDQPIVMKGEHEIAGFEDILASLHNIGNLNKLTLVNCGLEERSEQLLAHWMQNNGVLNALNLLGNPFPQGVKNIVAMYKIQETLDTLCGFKAGTKRIEWAGAGRIPSDLDLLAAEMDETGRRALEHVVKVDLSGEQNLGPTPEKHLKKVRRAGSTYRPYVYQRKSFYKGVEILPVDPKDRLDPDQPGAPEFSSDEEDSDNRGLAAPSRPAPAANDDDSDEYYDSDDEQVRPGLSLRLLGSAPAAPSPRCLPALAARLPARSRLTQLL